MATRAKSTIPWKAPQNDGEVLLVPGFDQSCTYVHNTRDWRRQVPIAFGDKPLALLAREARQHLLEGALRWTAAYRTVPSATLSPEQPLVLTGHQPELFHPGVWLKNFVAARIGSACNGVTINLLIDNDRLKSTSVPVLSGTLDQPSIVQVPFDSGSTEVALEQRHVADAELFASFPIRVKKHLAGWVEDPLLDRYWKMVLECFGRERRIGYLFAQARNRLEAEWGQQIWDIPLSSVVDQPSHQWFLAFLLSQAERLWHAYNHALAEFRRRHRLRNRAQPVPDLGRREDWWEVPYWIWTSHQPERRRLWVKQTAHHVELSDGAAWRVALSWKSSETLEKLQGHLSGLRSEGVLIRPRALLTTLYCRLILGDLFVHGIGGARYDEVTDGIILRLFGQQAPPFAVVSGTLWLAQPRSSGAAEQLRQVRLQLREIQFHPEKFFSNGAMLAQAREVLPTAPTAEIDHWLRTKQQWIHTPKTPENARQRHLAITECNRQLRGFLSPLEEKLRTCLALLRTALHRDNILRFREFPFCFFPENKLRKFFELGACQGGSNTL
jgi:hypothetical protein